MRILHLSDLHLDKKSLNDSTDKIINPIITTLKDIIKDEPIDLVAFTGDLINVGGKNFDKASDGFAEFISRFCNPILKALNLSPDRFYFTPGNHDIQRGSDHEVIEAGLTQTLNDEEAIVKLIENPTGIDRIKLFKEFEKSFYEKQTDLKKELTLFQSCYKIEIDNTKVGIACLNSSWRCYNSDTDKGKILIGEKQIDEAIRFFGDDCHIKIVLTHHHYSWLKPFDSEIIFELLKSNFDLFLCGHVHTSSSTLIQEPDGKLFTFCAPGILSAQIRSQDKKYINGFSIINYDLANAKVIVKSYHQDYPKKQFFPDNTFGDNGTWTIDIPRGAELERKIKLKNLLAQVYEDHSSIIDSHLLSNSTDTQAPKSIDALFVLPNIEFNSDSSIEKNIIIENISELVFHKRNLVISGGKESGKTVLLDKILLETLKIGLKQNIIPIYLDFKEIKDNFLYAIRDFLGQSLTQTSDFINSSNILLLIDNISFSEEDKDKIKKLHSFLEKNKGVRFIATYLQLYEQDFVNNLEFINGLNFVKGNIKQFKAKHINILTKNWFQSSNNDFQNRLESVTKGFLALNLPRTPFAVSMFLWIIEKQGDFKPINNATLIENFIEKLLNKHGTQEVFSDRFNYDNKIWLLADIAYYMLESNNDKYGLSYGNFISFIEKYLEKKSFDFKASTISKELLKHELFTQEKDQIHFRFTCFFEFFLVKKMQQDSSFLNTVLQEDEYLKYINEIDYYTGLFRGETHILKTIVDRLEKSFEEISAIIERSGKSIDDYFQSDNSFLDSMEQQEIYNLLPIEKPTKEEIEDKEDKKMSLIKSEEGIVKKSPEPKSRTLGKLLILALKVIKNSEEVYENNIKYNSYNTAINCLVKFSVMQKAILEKILKQKDGFPPEVVEIITILERCVPHVNENLLYEHIGSQKLASTIKKKINFDKENVVPMIEKYFSIFLYSDLKGNDYKKILSEYIKDSPRGLIQDNILFKLMTILYYNSKEEDTDNFYLNLIAESIVKTKGITKLSKGAIIEDYRKKKHVFKAKEKE